MTRKTHVGINIEMFIAFEVTVTGAAHDIYTVNDLAKMFAMRKSNSLETKFLFDKLVRTMTFRPQTRRIMHHRVRFSTDPANQTVNRLSQTINLTLNIIRKSRLKVTFDTTNFVMVRTHPVVIIRIHDMAGIAKPGCTGHLYRDNAEHNHKEKRRCYQNA
jgi:hypothetical protein